MTQRTRAVVVLGILVVVALGLVAIGVVNQRPVSSAEPIEGRIHVYMDGTFVANVDPASVTGLEQGSFEDLERGKEQSGPWAEALIRAHLEQRRLDADTRISVAGVRPSSGAAKEVTLTWSQLTDRDNHVLFDISGSGDALKLVSTLEELDVRDEWVQGVSRIDIITAP